MNSQQFIESGKAILKFVGSYHDNIGDFNVIPILEQGFLSKLIPCKYIYEYGCSSLLILNYYPLMR